MDYETSNHQEIKKVSSFQKVLMFLKKYAVMIFLWILILVMGGYLYYVEVMVKGKVFNLEQAVTLGAMLSAGGIIYFLLKKGFSPLGIKFIIILVCGGLFFLFDFLGL